MGAISTNPTGYDVGPGGLVVNRKASPEEQQQLTNLRLYLTLSGSLSVERQDWRIILLKQRQPSNLAYQLFILMLAFMLVMLLHMACYRAPLAHATGGVPTIVWH